MSIVTQDSLVDFEEGKKVPSETFFNDNGDAEREVNLEHGHMQELEVDLGTVVQDEKLEDYDGG